MGRGDTMIKYKPLIIIGLGKYGNEIVQNINKSMKEQDNIIFKIISCLALKDNGEFWDVKEDKLLFQCEGLKSEFHLDNYSLNFKSLLYHEKNFGDYLSDKISDLRRKELLIEFQDKGLSIDTPIEIFIVSRNYSFFRFYTIAFSRKIKGFSN